MKYFMTTLLIVIGGFIGSQLSYSEPLSSFAQGKKLYQQGKYEMALLFFERAYEKNPLNENLYFYLGNIYNHKKMFQKSIVAYKRGVELTSQQNKPYYLYNLAQSYKAAQEYKEAMTIYSQLESEDSQFPAIYLYRGMIQYQLKNKEETIKSWETYLTKDSKSSQYKSIRKAIDYLKDKNFAWPPDPSEKKQVVYIVVNNVGHPLAVGRDVKKEEVAKAERDEEKRIVEDEGQAKGDPQKDKQDGENDLARKLREKEEEEANKGIDESILKLKIDSEDLEVKDQEKKEGKEYDEIER